ncbi:MAG: NADH-quinone oxidoreductase subunit N [Planctomycetota bacterium]|nr:NADH-quinone oxidoreductase subunit N [Planctomycetota bacterium]MDP6838049.1 NADH-quinone oxidoreductase subunit N [Planctomycetota bacterium]MDP6956568.1 NADH-quinone oxidoreductase subunit N [Planctomycetota bacterium]
MDGYLAGLRAITPELTLTGLALLVLVYDLLKKGRDSAQVGIITLVGLGVVAVQLLGSYGAQPQQVLGMVTVDAFAGFFKLFTVGSLVVVTIFVLADRNERRHGTGEYYFLLLGAAIGIFFMVGTTNLLLLMLGLELLSLASYSLAGFHKGDRASAEAALKYVIFGGLSAGIMLYGISLLYGLTGSLDLGEMARGEQLAQQLTNNPTPVAIAILLVLAGFAYKVSVVPFHFWTPDVYEGAPTPVTTFLAVASKAAGFGALLRFIQVLFMSDGVREAVVSYGERIGLLLAILAAVTMTLGNLGALRQSSVKRMLAYSSIAHAGYLLMGLATMESAGFQAAMFYLAAYYFMNLGAFGFLLYFEGVTGSDTYESLKGLGWKAPLVSVAMVVFLVSLTGLPPTVGFYGKYLLFQEAIGGGFAWLAVVAGINSVISLFYYMRVAKMLFLAAPAEENPAPQVAFTGLVAGLGALTVLFGIYTSPIQDWVRASFGG